MNICFLVDEIAPGSAPVLIGKTILNINQYSENTAEVIAIKKNYEILNDKNFQEYFKNIKIRYIEDVYPKFLRKNRVFPFMSFFSLNHVISLFFAHKLVKDNEFGRILSFCQYTCFAAINLKLIRGIKYLTLLWDPSTFIANKIYKKRLNMIIYWVFIFFCWLLENLNIFFSNGIILTARNHLHYYKKITKKKINIISIGSKIDAPLNIPNFNRKDFLMYDRWDIGNDPSMALDILDSLNDKKIKLIIGGYWHPESMKEAFLDKMKMMGLSKRVILESYFDDKKIIEYSKKCLLYLHLIHDAFGMQVLECASNGCPSAIIEKSGVIELFKENLSIITLKKNKNDIVAKLNYFLKNIDFQKKLSINCHSVAKQNDYKTFALNLGNALKHK